MAVIILMSVTRPMAVAVPVRIWDWLRPLQEQKVAVRAALKMAMDVLSMPMPDARTRSAHAGRTVTSSELRFAS